MINKKISFIIPCFNCEKTLRESVESVYRQNLNDFEIILVDDKSTDGTLNVIEDIRSSNPEIVFLKNEKNMGGGATRNFGISKSTGEILVILDSDDALPDSTINKMVDFLHENNCDGVLYNKTLFFENNEKNITDTRENKVLDRNVEISDLFMRNYGFLTIVNFVFKKKLF